MDASSFIEQPEQKNNWRPQEKLPDDNAIDIIELDIALEKLHSIDERQSKVVEMRIFAERTNKEIADILDVSLATVKRDWTMARAWLCREIFAEGT